MRDLAVVFKLEGWRNDSSCPCNGTHVAWQEVKDQYGCNKQGRVVNM